MTKKPAEQLKAEDDSKDQKPTSTAYGIAKDDSSSHKRQQQLQLDRLQEKSRQQAQNIPRKTQPGRQEFVPYTFNGLEPYLDLTDAKFLHDLDDVDGRRQGHASRATATGLCTPQDSLAMDTEIPPKLDSPSSPRRCSNGQRSPHRKSSDDRPPAEGSTRLPKFPQVRFDTAAIPRKKNYVFTDVPEIRGQLQQQCGSNASRKVDADYKRTKDDFYRMQLDKMEAYSSRIRPRMRAAYFAYLQNSVGSSRAVHDCVQSVNNSDAHDGDTTAQHNDRHLSADERQQKPEVDKSSNTTTAAVKEEGKTPADDKKTQESKVSGRHNDVQSTTRNTETVAQDVVTERSDSRRRGVGQTRAMRKVK